MFPSILSTVSLDFLVDLQVFDGTQRRTWGRPLGGYVENVCWGGLIMKRARGWESCNTNGFGKSKFNFATISELCLQ